MNLINKDINKFVLFFKFLQRIPPILITKRKRNEKIGKKELNGWGKIINITKNIIKNKKPEEIETFYWHVAKIFYRTDLSFDEMNHINYDWYAPANAARQSPEEVREWCTEGGLKIEREVVEDAGITIIATKVD
jgi:hypothetical protein